MKFFASNILEQPIHQGVCIANSIFPTAFINKEGWGV